MRNLGQVFIGLILGITVLVGLYFYHNDQVNKAYNKGLVNCIKDTTYIIGDTVIIRDTIFVKPKIVKPKLKPYEPPDKPKYAIDTTVYFQESGKVRVYSEDVTEEINIEPIFYQEFKVRIDTMYIDKIKYVEVIEDKGFYKDEILVGIGAVIGASIIYLISNK